MDYDCMRDYLYDQALSEMEKEEKNNESTDDHREPDQRP